MSIKLSASTVLKLRMRNLAKIGRDTMDERKANNLQPPSLPLRPLPRPRLLFAV